MVYQFVGVNVKIIFFFFTFWSNRERSLAKGVLIHDCCIADTCSEVKGTRLDLRKRIIFLKGPEVFMQHNHIISDQVNLLVYGLGLVSFDGFFWGSPGSGSMTNLGLQTKFIASICQPVDTSMGKLWGWG